MAYYAQLENNIVTNVIQAHSKNWCETVLGGTWQETFIDNSQFFHYAGLGYNFDGTGFYSPQPYPSWTLDKTQYIWKAPKSYPTDGKMYNWSEQNQEWEVINNG